MSIDYTKLRKKLVPQPDGQDVLRLRTAVVSAVNSDGTVDIVLNDATVPDVPYLTGAGITAGTVVQVLGYRGSLLVIGSSAGADQAIGGKFWDEVTSDQTTTSSTGVAYMDVTLPAAGTYTFHILWVLNSTGSGGTPGWCLGGTAPVGSYSWGSQSTQYNTASGSQASRASGTSHPSGVQAVVNTTWADNGGFSSIIVKGRITVTAGGTLQFKLGRFSGTSTIGVKAGSQVTVDWVE